jgi:hypothetical protein
MNKKKEILKYSLLSFVSLVSLIAFFVQINPEGRPLIYIFVPVVFAWTFLFGVAQSVLTLLFQEKSSLRSILSIAIVSTAVLLLLLSGVDQLTVADIVLSFGLVIMSSFYFYRMWS